MSAKIIEPRNGACGKRLTPIPAFGAARAKAFEQIASERFIKRAGR